MTEITTTIDDSPILETSLEMPYTLTTGKAASVFVARLAQQQILGSRCDACQRTVVPAQDYCSRCGGEQNAFVAIAPTGVVSSLTRTPDGAIGLIRLDGVDTDLLHVIDESAGPVSAGDRVQATWAETPNGSILDLAGFAPGGAESSEKGEDVSLTAEEEEQLVAQVNYSLSLPYRHSYGPHYGRLFDELGANGRIVGAKCPSCLNVLVPPRGYCDVCFVKTEQFVDVKDTGRLQAFSVIHMEFVGQTRQPPYVYAEVVLDGSSTRLIHAVDGIDVARAADVLRVGMPVRAVWRDASERNGTLNDIEYFEPIDEGE